MQYDKWQYDKCARSDIISGSRKTAPGRPGVLNTSANPQGMSSEVALVAIF